MIGTGEPGAPVNIRLHGIGNFGDVIRIARRVCALTKKEIVSGSMAVTVWYNLRSTIKNFITSTHRTNWPICMDYEKWAKGWHCDPDIDVDDINAIWH